MRILVLENHMAKMSLFYEYLSSLNWFITLYPLQFDNILDTKEIRKFLNHVCKHQYDVVILDLALTEGEERNLNQILLAGAELPDDIFTGFTYCKALVSERLGIPIVIMTKIPDGRVARIAMRIGADRILIKKSENEFLANELRNLVRTKTPHDPSFYWQLRSEISSSNDLWQSELLQEALDRFFLRSQNTRRFALFTASLSGILSPFLLGKVEAEKKLMFNLVSTQTILSLADSKLRDHVKHTGNLFWMGYRLLQNIEEYDNPIALNGTIPALYSDFTSITPKEQILNSWTIACLFHDCGYIDEKQNLISGLFNSLLPNISVNIYQPEKGPTWHGNIQRLRNFVEELIDNKHFLYNYIDTMIALFGNEHELNRPEGGTSPLIDHGFLSAHRMLNTFPLSELDDTKRNIVLHAALAIICHTYPDTIYKWKFDESCKGQLPIGTFPVCNLLALCDSIQTWDRELEVDPTIPRTTTYEGLLERLVLTDSSYVSGSEIKEFLINRNDDLSGYDLHLCIRYYVDAANNVKEVCEELSADIRRWIHSCKLRSICEIMEISSLIKGKIIYELPILSGKHEAPF